MNNPRRATWARSRRGGRAASAGGLAALLFSLLSVSSALVACGRKTTDRAFDPIGASTHEGARGVSFAFDSLDARSVSTGSVSGKPTVLAFVTTWDLSSQAQIDFLVAMSQHDGDRVNYVMIALQEPKDREIVEAFRASLHVDFPVALGDAASIAGGGPFGDVHSVPTLVVLDRAGRVAWRRVGLARSDEIRAALRGL